jgi:hypothetical protein
VGEGFNKAEHMISGAQHHDRGSIPNTEFQQLQEQIHKDTNIELRPYIPSTDKISSNKILHSFHQPLS